MALGAGRLLQRLSPSSTCLLVCDVQERFRELIHQFDAVAATAGLLVSTSRLLDIPCIATEQVPAKLGVTVPEVGISPPDGVGGIVPVVEKVAFSMVTEGLLREINAADAARDQPVRAILLVGIETHVCVQQTCLDLLERGYEVTLVADGLSSQRAHDRAVALELMQSAGARVSTAESCIFELLRTAKHEKFKSCSALVKARAHHWQ